MLVNQRQSTHVRFTMMMNAPYYLARFNVAASRRNIIVLRAVLCARKRNVYETKRRSAVHYFYIASHIFRFTSTLCIRNEKFNFSELCRVENASGILSLSPFGRRRSYRKLASASKLFVFPLRRELNNRRNFELEENSFSPGAVCGNTFEKKGSRMWLGGGMMSQGLIGRRS